MHQLGHASDMGLSHTNQLRRYEVRPEGVDEYLTLIHKLTVYLERTSIPCISRRVIRTGILFKSRRNTPRQWLTF